MGGDSRERTAAGCGREVEMDGPRDLIYKDLVAFLRKLQGPDYFFLINIGTQLLFINIWAPPIITCQRST